MATIKKGKNMNKARKWLSNKLFKLASLVAKDKPKTVVKKKTTKKVTKK